MKILVPIAAFVVLVSGCAPAADNSAVKGSAPSASPPTRALERKADMEEQRKEALTSAQHLADEEKRKSK